MTYRNQFQHPKPTLRLSGSADDKISQLKKEIEDLHESLGKNLTREFEAIRLSGGGTTVINRTSISGGGGGSSTRFSIAVSQSVTGSAVSTVNFPDIGSSGFGVFAFVLLANGDFSQCVPQIPPLSDSRTTNSVQVRHFESGTMWSFIILDA